ncbi:MAG: hypothetical protein L3J03_04365 [Desulfobacterales bacterium]|nr:hypothetical protein [Desulfobacterales bacterium]
MIKDYSDRCPNGSGRNGRRPGQIIARRSPAAADGRLMLKTIGVLVVLTLGLGVGSTVYYGLRIRSALDQIGHQAELNTKLVTRNRELIAHRDRLLTRENIEKAAAGLGLFPPSPGQLRRP